MGGNDDRPGRDAAYTRTRIRLAILFGVVAALLACVDAIPGFDVDAVVLGLLLGAALALLGLEAGGFLKR